MYSIKFISSSDVLTFVETFGFSSLENLNHLTVLDQESKDAVSEFKRYIKTIEFGTYSKVLQEFNDGNNVWEAWVSFDLNLLDDVVECLTSGLYTHTQGMTKASLKEKATREAMRRHDNSCLKDALKELDFMSEIKKVMEK